MTDTISMQPKISIITVTFNADKVLEILGFADAKEFRAYLTELLGVVEVPEDLLQADAKGIMANPGKLKNYPFETSAEEMAGMAN